MLVPESSRLTDLGVDVETIDKARLAASRQLREAIGARYVCPDSLDTFPGTAQGAELRALVEQHGIALAAAFLSQHDGGRSRKVAAEGQVARVWLDDVKAGRVDLSNVLARRQGIPALRAIFRADLAQLRVRGESTPAMLPSLREPSLVDDRENLDDVISKAIDDAVGKPHDSGTAKLSFDLLVVQRRFPNAIECLIHLREKLAAQAIPLSVVSFPCFQQLVFGLVPNIETKLSHTFEPGRRIPSWIRAFASSHGVNRSGWALASATRCSSNSTCQSESASGGRLP